MHKPVIVIVDSGVDESHPQFANDKISQIVFSLTRSEVKNTAPIYGHGTAIYGIIRACLNIAEIINIKVVDIEKGVDEDTLISVLEYIDTNINANIINLSLGIRIIQNKKALQDVCDRLSNKGVIIVSAFDNSGSISYPAAINNVIGVLSSNNCVKITDFSLIYDNNGIVNIAAKGGIQRVVWSEPKYLLLSGNSIACAHVTVQVAKFYNDGYHQRKQILDEFGRIALNKYSYNDNEVKSELFSISKAVIFPFNKEMHSLIRYHKNLSFDIVDVYDVKYSANIGSSTRQILHDDSVADFRIKNISNIDYNSFDTIILGHLDELSNLINKDMLRTELLHEAIKHGKKIYAFDDLKRSNGIDKSENIFYPTVSHQNLPANRFGMLYRISKPVVGIFGTSSRQGKFTLQLALRDILCKRGYDVGQIGTEPSSLLYGMDYVYPMGYNSSVYTSEYDSVRHLNYLVNNLCEAEKDIIIVGSQSGTVLYDTGNLRNYTISQYIFLLGTLPDSVILCINPYDDMRYIERTISFIESSVKSKVIALVIFPMELSEDWTGMYGAKKSIDINKITELKEKYATAFNMPIFCIGNADDYVKIADEIEDYFCR